MGDLRIEIEGITGIKDFLPGSNFEGQFSLQDINEFDTRVPVGVKAGGGHAAEIGKVGVKFAVGGQEIERFEIEGSVSESGSLGEMQALLLAHRGECALIALPSEEEIQTKTEDHGDTRERRKS